MFQMSKGAADNTHAQLLRDFDAVKARLDGLQGAGAAAQVIREARIAEAIG